MFYKTRQNIIFNFYNNCISFIFNPLVTWSAFFLSLFIYFYWRLITLQYYSGFCYTAATMENTVEIP